MNPAQLLLGLLLGVMIAGVAWRLKALTPDGALTAALVGGLIYGLGGLAWALPLLAFFISSSILSRIFASRNEQLIEKFAKSSRRDWGQVLANGGLGVFLVVLKAVNPDVAWYWVAYCGAMAAVTADTWATELGVLSQRPARLVTTGNVVETGTSGAVSPLGLAASLVGAGLIGGVGWGAAPKAIQSGSLLLAVMLGGFCGALFDSLLGATVQGVYYCPACQKETEQRPTHLCGTETIHRRGRPWLNNDLVNLGAATLGAGSSLVLFSLLSS